jgi:hypothetical protein
MNNDLLEITPGLTAEHLSLAVEQFFSSRELRVNPTHPWSWIKAKRYSLSSIIHAYSGLESATNVVGYNLFFNPDSNRYVPPEQRDIPLKRMVDAWQNRLSNVDKLNYILSVSGSNVPPRLESELRELNSLRNWLAHGFPYKYIVLVEKQETGTLLEVDREDMHNWQSRFSNTKFHPPDRIDDTDAHTAIRIVLESLKVLALQEADTLFWIDPLLEGPDLTFVTAEFDIEAYLKG